MLVTLAEKIVNGYFASVPRSIPASHAINNALLIAHRGAHNNAQGIFENTKAAFTLAKQAGCWGIEFDVHATADDILVVNHDPTLKRLWGHDKAISELNFIDLRALAPAVPTLAEVIEEYSSSMHLFIELKSPFTRGDALLHTLKELTPCQDYHLLTLKAPVFTQLSQFPRQSLLLVALHNNVKHFCDVSIAEQYGGVMANYLLLNDSYCARLKAADQRYGVGFVDSKNSLYREINRGMQWVFTNQAVKVGGYLRQLKGENSGTP